MCHEFAVGASGTVMEGMQLNAFSRRGDHEEQRVLVSRVQAMELMTTTEGQRPRPRMRRCFHFCQSVIKSETA